MKITRLLCISAILLSSSYQAMGQVRAKAKSFYILIGIGGYSAHTDSIAIESQVADTTYFYSLDLKSHEKTRYIQRGPLVTDSSGRLLFDHTLSVGQKLHFSTGPYHDSFMVDSITYVKLGAVSYKTWNLHLLDTMLSFRFSWTQGFGSLNFGWNYGDYRTVDKSSSRKAICLNDTVVYWDTSFNGFEPSHPDPTCDYHLLEHLLSFNEAEIADGLKIYPVPVSGLLSIESPYSGTLTLLDLQGRALMSQPISSGFQQLNTSQLQSGTYWIAFHTEHFTTSRKLIISR